MGQALYRKYRSKSLDEIVGQEHITDTLNQALKSGRISHAYLFSGPRGVGKTSIARILAHDINRLPYDETAPPHLDIIEIDAASNNGVEDVRELREKVYVTPAQAKYKVYIIDEVHMLSKAAFNALLKTLEEPPAHAVFILATTEAHKLPDTIISRTQHYTFRPVEQTKVVNHLREIADSEGVKIDDEALVLLAAHGGGAFRDSISLLDQAGSLGQLGGKNHTVNEADIRQLLGIAPDEAIDQLIAAIAQGSGPAALLTQLSQLYDQGLQAASIASQLAAKLRGGLSAGTPALPITQSLQLMKQLIEVPASRNPERLLEIVLIEPVAGSVPAPAGATAQSAQSAQATPTVAVTITPAPPRPTVTPVVAAPQPAAKAPAAKQTPAAKPDKAPAASTPAAAAPAPPAPAAAIAPTHDSLDDAAWLEVLQGIKKQYNTIYGVLRMAQPIFSDGSVELQFKFAFHQKRLNEVKNKQIIADFIKQVTGKEVEINCIYLKDGVASGESSDSGAPTEAVATISNIFGGAEIL